MKKIKIYFKKNSVIQRVNTKCLRWTTKKEFLKKLKDKKELKKLKALQIKLYDITKSYNGTRWADHRLHNKKWYDICWNDKHWYDKEWYNMFWFNKFWYNMDWYNDYWYDRNWNYIFDWFSEEMIW